MGKKRKTHSPQFKAKVALAAIQNDESTASQSIFDPQKSRLFNVAEHCRVKGIPESAVKGQSVTAVHEIPGQSVLFGVVKSI